ncbi:MAG: hypothetical protein MZU84_02860 [Sphingobacterium sp.]|nr:hypothetical protein [Sphingobacterium sp.]
MLVPESTLIQEQKILVEGQETEIEFHPSVRKYYVELQPPTLTDPSPGSDPACYGVSRRMAGLLQKRCMFRWKCMREIPALLRHSDWKVTGTIALVPGVTVLSISRRTTRQNVSMVLQ